MQVPTVEEIISNLDAWVTYSNLLSKRVAGAQAKLSRDKDFDSALLCVKALFDKFVPSRNFEPKGLLEFSPTKQYYSYEGVVIERSVRETWHLGDRDTFAKYRVYIEGACVASEDFA